MKMHIWLRSLSDKLEKDDIQELLHRIKQLPETADQELADSVLRVCLEANKQTIQTWEGDANMFEYLLDFMQPQLQEMEDKKVEEAATYL
jgi:hypothetical protein